jgi:hypothetical protein
MRRQGEDEPGEQPELIKSRKVQCVRNRVENCERHRPATSPRFVVPRRKMGNEDGREPRRITSSAAWTQGGSRMCWSRLPSPRG